MKGLELPIYWITGHSSHHEKIFRCFLLPKFFFFLAIKLNWNFIDSLKFQAASMPPIIIKSFISIWFHTEVAIALEILCASTILMGKARSKNCYFAIISKYIANAAFIIFRRLSVFHLDFNWINLHAPIKVKSNFPFCFLDNTASLVTSREMHFLIAFIFTLETVLDH